MTSLNAWKGLHYGYDRWLPEQAKHGYPNTVNTVKALLFIKSNRPDIIDASFLNSTSTSTLAAAYDLQRQSKDVGSALSFPNTPYNRSQEMQKSDAIKNKGLKILKNKRPLDLDSLKTSCKQTLMNYINSRGSISPQGEFKPSFWTWLFRNNKLTERKVKAARILISTIEETNSPSALVRAIKGMQKNAKAIKAQNSWSSSDFT